MKRLTQPPCITGFTLIELMIVVVVIGILASVAYPIYTDQVRKTHRGLAKADLVELAQLAERFHTVNNTYVGFSLGSSKGTFTKSPREGTARYYDLQTTTLENSKFVITASPVGDQGKDSCGTLSIDQLGKKMNTMGDDNCW